MERYITSYCSVRNRQISVNGNTVFQQEKPGVTAEGFFVAAYQHFEVKYSKFHKMDVLSKLAFTAMEALTSTVVHHAFAGSRTGIVFSNRSSTIITDTQHRNNLQKDQGGVPSPATFVYTLPNIMIGEISIRHQLTGENVLFVADTFPINTVVPYSNFMMDQHICDRCLCGWVDASLNDYHAFLYVVEGAPRPIKKNALLHTPAGIQNLYVTNH